MAYDIATKVVADMITLGLLYGAWRLFVREPR